MKEQNKPIKDSVVEKQLEFLDGFIDSLLTPLYITDINTCMLVRANTAARAVGIEEGTPCYKTLYNMNEPCDESMGNKCPAFSIRQGIMKIPSHQRAEHAVTGGYIRVFERLNHLILDKDGKPALLLKYPFEISELLLVEKMLKQLDKNYSSLNKKNKSLKSKAITYIPRGKYFQKKELAIWSRPKMTEVELIRTKLKLEALQQLERLKTELLSTVSHELRNPLSSIKGYTSTLLAEDVEWNKEKRRDFLNEISEEADRLNRLIGDLLDMSRLEAGILKMEREPCSIHSLFESIKGRLVIITQHHRLEVETLEGMPMVNIDEMRIGEVITNLVENATRFSEKDSMIKLDAVSDDDHIVISITDNGVGIPKERLDKVFDRFYSTYDAPSGQRKGLGLGLSISRGIIESHGGKIWLESKLGQGSKFSFSLPVVNQSTKAREQK